MGKIVSQIEITAPLEKVFGLAQKVEDFPKFMPDVKTVEIRERNTDGHTVSYWEAVASLQNIKKVIRWEEEEHWNPNDFTCAFSQTKGDYKHYEGSWKFETAGDSTKVELIIDYDLGLPLVGPLIKQLLDKIMKDNCNSMLNALKKRAEKSS